MDLKLGGRVALITGPAKGMGAAITRAFAAEGSRLALIGRDTAAIEALADEMMSVIVETAHEYAMPGTMKGVEIVASKLGDNAGITGGAVLAKREAK